MLASPVRLGAGAGAAQLRSARALTHCIPASLGDLESSTPATSGLGAARGLHSSTPTATMAVGRADPLKALKEGQVRLLKGRLEGLDQRGLHGSPLRRDSDAVDAAPVQAAEHNFRVRRRGRAGGQAWRPGREKGTWNVRQGWGQRVCTIGPESRSPSPSHRLTLGVFVAAAAGPHR